MIDPKLVGIAQLAIVKAPEQLCCLGLGSCVAVFIYEPDMRMGGVVHVLLPKAPQNREIDEKYADTGVKKLVNELLVRGARKERLRAKLVGGAQMFPNLNLHVQDIGAENCREVKRVLRELGIRVVSEETQGNRGRSVVFNMEDGKALVTTAFSPQRMI
jgi:chemotaxis protein CheD